jgi:predicted AAA+ superfamily ATPase
MKPRTIQKPILSDLDKKIVLLSGPRQVGKTTLSKAFFPKSSVYLNFDRSEDRAVLRQKSWDRSQDLLILDELHKMKSWKTWVKGVYDTEGVRPRLIITGSARMDVYRRMGDSLAGRHFSFRLHPFSFNEMRQGKGKGSVDSLLQLGGFPEPLINGSDVFAARWRRSHLERILREDLLDLESVRDIKAIEILVELLADRVGSPISYSSLARDLEVSAPTVKRWIAVLESLFVIFVVTPYSKNVAKAILKEPKIYFYDTGRVTAGPGGKLENLVATHLLKRGDFIEDTLGKKMSLHYVKNKDRHEVDFLTLVEKKPEWLVEVKQSDMEFSKSLLLFGERLRPQRAIQVVKEATRARSLRVPTSVDLLPLVDWLAELET